jgi:hypothetical protein
MRQHHPIYEFDGSVCKHQGDTYRAQFGAWGWEVYCRDIHSGGLGLILKVWGCADSEDEAIRDMEQAQVLLSKAVGEFMSTMDPPQYTIVQQDDTAESSHIDMGAQGVDEEYSSSR